MPSHANPVNWFEIPVTDTPPAAKKEAADMIVLGSRGLGHIAGLVMGSVSHKVSHLSDCTCITVK